MRIAVAAARGGLEGGAESYLGDVMPALASSGQEVGFLHETEPAAGVPMIPLAPAAVRWPVARIGTSEAVRQLAEWQPDVIWTHGLVDTSLWSELLAIAPNVLLAHDYYGTCISGRKSFAFPRLAPCSRVFGPACLASFYPRRCGGLSAATMVRLYRQQSARLDLVRRAAAVVTLSRHMRLEYVKHGVLESRVHCVPPPVPHDGCGRQATSRTKRGSPSRLLFMGRMFEWKGGSLLIEALPALRRVLGRPILVTFAGEGPERERWAAKALRLHGEDPGLAIQFEGWVGRQRREELLASHDVMVVPSTWPEPYGLVGWEAAAFGMPSVAFAVGGIVDWLVDGVNGCLAPGDPPTSDGLANALVRCLETPAAHERLARGAVERLGAATTLAAHVSSLVSLFERCRRRVVAADASR